jgi:hypothetical protein
MCSEASNGRSVQELDRSRLRPFLTLTDLHPHTLPFRWLIQSAALERRGMNEDVLAAAVRRYETKPFLEVVPFD